MSGLVPLRTAIRRANDPLVVMRRVVDQVIALNQRSDGAVIELAHAGQLMYVCAAGTLREHVGTRLSLDASLSGLAVKTGQTLYCEDSTTDQRVNRQACERIGAISFVCTPLLHGVEPIGVLKVSAGRPHAFTSHDITVLARLAKFVSAVIGAMRELSHIAGTLLDSLETEAGADDEQCISEFVANVLHPGILDALALKRQIEHSLATDGFHMICQPIVEIDSGRIVGAEALARFAGPPQQPPDAWFADAAQIGLGVQLELAAVKKALPLLDELPEHAFLAINIGPEALAAPELFHLLEHGRPERLVIELTEHVRIDNYPHVRRALKDLRVIGTRLAVDDTGAGFASLAHILNLAPDLIKLDAQFGHGIDTNPDRRAVTRALVGLARETGAQVIAEGIETTAELETVRRLGIHYAQGYLFSPPRPVSSLPRRFPALLAPVTD